jgi:hypothetical protein
MNLGMFLAVHTIRLGSALPEEPEFWPLCLYDFRPLLPDMCIFVIHLKINLSSELCVSLRAPSMGACEHSQFGEEYLKLLSIFV